MSGKKILLVAIVLTAGICIFIFRQRLNDYIPHFRPVVVNNVQVTKTVEVFPEVVEQTTTMLAGAEIENDTASPIKIKAPGLEGDIVLSPRGKLKILDTKEQYKKNACLSLTFGKINVNVKKLGWKEEFNVKTPTAVAGVRGTVYSLDVNERQETAIHVPEGRVWTQHPTTGQSMVLNQGEKILMNRTSMGIAEKMSKHEILNDLSSFGESDAFLAEVDKYKKILDHEWPGSSKGFRMLDLNSGYLNLENNPRVAYIDILQDIPLTYLSLSHTHVRSIAPIEHHRLYHLSLWKSMVSDIRPLQSMPLTFLNLEETKINDIKPLAGKKITYLYLGGTEVSDISPIEGMRLKTLTLWKTKIRDINVVRNMPLEWLSLSGTAIKDFSPIYNLQSLKVLALQNSGFNDLESISKMDIESLVITPKELKPGWEKILESMTSLKVLAVDNEEFMRRQSPAQFWEKFKSGQYK